MISIVGFEDVVDVILTLRIVPGWIQMKNIITLVYRQAVVRVCKVTKGWNNTDLFTRYCPVGSCSVFLIGYSDLERYVVIP